MLFFLWKFETSAGNMIYWPVLIYVIKILVKMTDKTYKSQGVINLLKLTRNYVYQEM